MKKFGDAEQFLYSPFSQFDAKDTFEFFETRGLPLVTEEWGRVSPKTQKASDVFGVMEEYVTSGNVSILTGSPVIKINKEGSKIVSVDTRGGVFAAENYVLATGGASHPETGSTGDGFGWLKDLGHTVRDSVPNIVPLKVRDQWVRNLSGVTLADAKITFYVGGKKGFAKRGRILFTHFGLSGPMILNSARKVDDLMYEGAVTASIDCYPDKDLGALDKHIIEIFEQNKNKSFKNVAKEIMPEGMHRALVDLEMVGDIDKKVHSISKEERKRVVQLLKALPVDIAGLMGLDRAVISGGGVSLR